MSLVLDSGAWLAVERDDRFVLGLIRVAQKNRVRIVTPSAVVAQVWRGGPGQALVAALLAGVVEHPLTPQSARRIGLLLRRSGTADVVDGAVVDASANGDEVLTSDPTDIARLAAASQKRLTVIAV